MATVQKITPFIWFDSKAEEAANFYVSLFDDSNILHVTRYPEGGAAPAGSAMTVDFQLAGLKLIALNGGPHFKLNESFSLFVSCDSQQEVDTLWSKLTADGGQESRCGWLKDRWGLSWQIVPARFMELMKQSNPKQAQAVMGAMMQMKKFDIAALEKAYSGA